MNAEQAETTVSNSDNTALLLCKTYWNTQGETLPSARHTFFQVSSEYNEIHMHANMWLALSLMI